VATAAATATATAAATATATASRMVETAPVAASAPLLAQRAVAAPEAIAHRLGTLCCGTLADARPHVPAGSSVYLAVPGHGGVWRRAADDEKAPDNPTFRRFFSALPELVRQCIVDRRAVDLRSLVAALPNVANCPTETALDVLSAKGAVGPEGCATLRRAVDARRSMYPDSVDRMPEHQLDISREELEAYIGKPTVAKLWQLPCRLAAQRASGLLPVGSSDFVPPSNTPHHVEIFVRRYSRGTRPLLSFHRDACAVTVNVALSADQAHTGGRLLAIVDEAVQEINRQEGEVTVHTSDVLHAVTAVEAGLRYSLLLFFYHQAAGGPSQR